MSSVFCLPDFLLKAWKKGHDESWHFWTVPVFGQDSNTCQQILAAQIKLAFELLQNNPASSKN